MDGSSKTSQIHRLAENQSLNAVISVPSVISDFVFFFLTLCLCASVVKSFFFPPLQ